MTHAITITVTIDPDHQRVTVDRVPVGAEPITARALHAAANVFEHWRPEDDGPAGFSVPL